MSRNITAQTRAQAQALGYGWAVYARRAKIEEIAVWLDAKAEGRKTKPPKGVKIVKGELRYGSPPKLRGTTRARVQQILTIHDRMQGAYFYSPPGSARNRREYEDRHSNAIIFTLGGHCYAVEQCTDCSCKNVYYRLTVTVDGEKKDVRALRRIL